MVTSTNIREAATAIDAGYTMAQMNKGIAKYVRHFLNANHDLLIKEGVGASEFNIMRIPNPKKWQLATITGIPFASETLFKAFRNTLPQQVREIMRALIWRESLTNHTIKKDLGFDIYNIKEKVWSAHYTKKTYSLKPEFEFFLNKGNENAYYSGEEPLFNLSIGASLQRIIRQYYPRPRYADLHFVDKIEETDYLFEGEKEILLEFPRLEVYAMQGNIKTTSNGKVSVATLNKMQKKVGIKEFYPEDEEKLVKGLRSCLLGGLICARKRKVAALDIHEKIRSLIKHTFKEHYLSPVTILPYFKGMSYFDSYYDNSNVRAFTQVFSKLPVGKWVTAKNFVDYLRYNSLDDKPISYQFSRDKLYFDKRIKTEHGNYNEKHYIGKGAYHSCVLLPYQKGICFLFAAYGLLDIAYNKVDFSEPGETSNSPYEGLAYLRLTNLGAYALELVKEYELPESFKKSVTILSEDSLTITVDADDTTAPMVLEPYAVRVSPNRYRTDFSFFLKGVKDKKELQNKITLFKQAVKVDLPENWVEFFTEVRGKIDPLTKYGAVKVFKIPQENKELLKLIARDPILQKHSMKAENYHLIVPNKSMAAFKARMREFGYLLS
jgi:hypothetical protein